MDHDALGLWLEQNGLRILARSMLATDGSLQAGNTQRSSLSTVTELDPVDPEDDENDREDGRGR